MPLAVSARRSRALGAVALTLLAPLAAAPLGAQTAPGGDRPARIDPFCWRGRPLPRCRAFALFELGLYGGLSTSLREPVAFPTADFATRTDRAFGTQLGWTVGAMRNRDPATALGGALVIAVAADGGNLVAGTARWRRWTGRRTSVELAAGPGAAQVPLPLGPTGYASSHQPNGWRLALLGEARANAADLAAVSVRGMLVPHAGGRAHGALFAGASVGSGLAVAGTVGLGAFVALLIVALAGGLS